MDRSKLSPAHSRIRAGRSETVAQRLQGRRETLLARLVRQRRQIERLLRQLAVGHAVEQVADQVEAAAAAAAAEQDVDFDKEEEEE